jgi:transcriptional regulator with XRE-family HTH domain
MEPHEEATAALPQRGRSTRTREPNHALREARQRQGPTRQQLADAVNAIDVANPDQPMTAHALGKLEQGLIRWPAKHRRDALRQILGVSGDAELGFHNPRA